MIPEVSKKAIKKCKGVQEVLQMCATEQLVVDRTGSPSGNQCRHAAMCFFSTKGVMVFRHIHKFPIGRADTSG